MPELPPDWDDPGALFQIEEPARAATASHRAGFGIGIDLGTTHSLVALASHGQAPRALSLGQGPDADVLLPSVVAYLDGEVVVGRAARQAQVEHPSQVISSVKRFMGRRAQEVGFGHAYNIDDQGPVPRFCVDGRRVSPMEVSAEILKVLRLRAEAELGGPVDGAVITVPAYFDDAQRQATRDAGRIAGLNVYRLLAEPTAAAVAYGLDRGDRGLFVVYDLGGGTFDISILRLHGGVFQVLATGGDSALGGDDFDRALAAHLLGIAGVAAPTPHQRVEAEVAARHAKEALSSAETVDVELVRCGLSAYRLSRAECETIWEPIARRSLPSCRRVLKDAGVDLAEVDGVVLVGGSTRMPLVRRLVERLFGKTPLCDIDPDQVVAFGAAITADVLSGSAREGLTLLDVVPLSLGLETMGGIVEKVIPRNATIPVAARQVFTNYSEEQTGMVIHVVQGERELATDCRSLARFELRGLPALPPSMARIEVTFQLDADALLTVTARELMTGVKQSVEVKPAYGLSADEVEQLVIDGYDHAEEDFAQRDRAEARVELGRVILAIRRALTESGAQAELLPDAERVEVESALGAAEAAMSSTDCGQGAKELVAVREALERASEPFARRRMEQALLAGMGGRRVGDVETAIADEHTLAQRRGAHNPEPTPPR